MKPFLTLCSISLFLFACSSVPKKELNPDLKEPEKILAEIHKIEVPYIEKRTRLVRIPVEASRPSVNYSQEEIEISKSDTGYEVRLWLLKGNQPCQSLSFKREISFQIPVSGGHDIEIIGKNKRFLELIFIDEWE